MWVQDEERADANRLDVVGFSRMKYDKSLLSCIVDRWRAETHTFHFPWGEMAPTLQDVSFLLGLPLAGQAIGLVDVPDNWRVEMRDRFAAAFEDFEAPWEGFEEIEPLKQFDGTFDHGPEMPWLQRFEVHLLSFFIDLSKFIMPGITSIVVLIYLCLFNTAP